mmetsp:Transcript_33459/g.44152  ORF Transcript_33459/g.44152 Transcript_33459/m.44152 type:complete len:364 (+) Transcript_33459:116-1207(+)
MPFLKFCTRLGYTINILQIIFGTSIASIKMEMVPAFEVPLGSRKLESKKDCQDFLSKFHAILLDCDGVLWRGGELLPHVAETLEIFRKNKKKLFFITNNSSKSRSQCREKFLKFGIEVAQEEIVPVTFAAADYLSSEHPDVKKAFVVGAQGLCDELNGHGIATVGGAAEEFESNFIRSESDFSKVEPDPEVGAVVCGWDTNFHFAKLCVASLYLQKSTDCLFVATNLNEYDELGDRNIPGNGCLVKAVETSVGRPPVVVGKPYPWLIKRILQQHGLDPATTIMIGDRIDMDVMLAKNGGTSSALVMTGCTKMEDIRNGIEAKCMPDFVLPSLGQFAEILKNADDDDDDKREMLNSMPNKKQKI